VGIRDALAERIAAIRTLTYKLLRLEMRRILKQTILKMVVIRTVTMICMIWLSLMIYINDSKIRQKVKHVFSGRCMLCVISVKHICPGGFYLSQLLKKVFSKISNSIFIICIYHNI